MHLIQRMKVWKELRQLERRVREEPAPNTFVDLGQVYINLDMHEKARQVAAAGLALFPRANELRQLHDCARRGIRQKRAAELRAKVTRSPSQNDYRELAQLLVEVGDTASLHAVCQEWNVRFPDDPGCWLLLGQTRLANFYRDLSAREGHEAARCLQRVLRMQPADPQARRLLAELLYRIGAVRVAQRHLRELLAHDAGNQQIAALLAYVSTLEDHGDDLQGLLAEVEQHGSLRHPPMPTRPPTGDDGGLAGVRDGLSHVAEMPGVSKAAFIRGAKALVKGAIRDGRDPFLRSARVIARSAHRFARKVDIGSATKMIVEGPFGRICVCVYGEVLAAALCDARADGVRVMAELQEIVAGMLAAAGEGGR